MKNNFVSLADDPLLCIDECSRLLQTHHSTIRRMLKTGVLRGIQINGPHSPWRIRRSKLLALIGENENGKTV
jgi:excisionase family DNA binding protein